LDKGKKYGFEVNTLGLEACEIEGLGAFCCWKGSQNEPQFVVMTYTPKETVPHLKHVGLVGKGITLILEV
jgi:leucyl aminopeptidase